MRGNLISLVKAVFYDKIHTVKIKLLNDGFTLIEIMIVVAIIALSAAIAIPNLLRARLNANESIAIATCRTLSTALQSFRAANPIIGFPADLTGLAVVAPQPSYADTRLTVVTPTKRDYNFTYTVGAGLPAIQYHISAVPINANAAGVRGFYIDEQGVICAIAVAAGDPGHAAAGSVCPVGYIAIQ